MKGAESEAVLCYNIVNIHALCSHFIMHLLLSSLYIQFRSYLSGPWYTLKCRLVLAVYVRFVEVRLNFSRGLL